MLLAAAIATYRKSALLAPLTVVLTIAYFRRRELVQARAARRSSRSCVDPRPLPRRVRLDPRSSCEPSAARGATVSDRAADYDAVRPDVWSHLAFGRGYGSYDHVSYRILDSEMLSRLVEIGRRWASLAYS